LIAQFTVYSYPSLGSLGLLLSLIVLVIALFLTLREVKPSE